jgi:hypothetical protein
MLRVGELILLLQQLPPETQIFTNGLEGVYPIELGNFCPFKVLETPFCIRLYIDDGLSSRDSQLLKRWEPLDEWIIRWRKKNFP